MAAKPQRPADDDYFVGPWSPVFFQGDIFENVPLGFPAPPDAVILQEGTRRFITGPFDAGLAMLVNPTCLMAAQGAPEGSYAHPARTLAPIRPVDELLADKVISESSLGHLRGDRKRGFMYLPSSAELGWRESAALLYLPITIHHTVIAQDRVAQLTGSAFWHLRVLLMALWGGLAVDSTEASGRRPPPTIASSSPQPDEARFYRRSRSQEGANSGFGSAASMGSFSSGSPNFHRSRSSSTVSTSGTSITTASHSVAAPSARPPKQAPACPRAHRSRAPQSRPS